MLTFLLCTLSLAFQHPRLGAPVLCTLSFAFQHPGLGAPVSWYVNLFVYKSPICGFFLSKNGQVLQKLCPIWYFRLFALFEYAKENGFSFAVILLRLQQTTYQNVRLNKIYSHTKSCPERISVSKVRENAVCLQNHCHIRNIDPIYVILRLY